MRSWISLQLCTALQNTIKKMKLQAAINNMYIWEMNWIQKRHKSLPRWQASQVKLVVKNLPANAGDTRHCFNPWVWKMPWRRAWQPTPVFLPGESHRQRSLAGYSPWACVHAHTHTHTHTHILMVAIPFSRGSSHSRDQTQVSCTAGGYFTSWATREVPNKINNPIKNLQNCN